MRESTVEARLKREIEKRGGLCIKFVSPGYTGVPDRIVLMRGGFVAFVETKAPGEKERKRQQYVQSMLRRFGLAVYSTVDTPEKAAEVAEDCLRRSQAKRKQEEKP